MDFARRRRFSGEDAVFNRVELLKGSVFIVCPLIVERMLARLSIVSCSGIVIAFCDMELMFISPLLERARSEVDSQGRQAKGRQRSDGSGIQSSEG